MLSDEGGDYTPDSMLIVISWAQRVCIVCDRKQIARPTLDEWNKLKSKFHPDKAPIDSVAELEDMRKEALHATN